MNEFVYIEQRDFNEEEQQVFQELLDKAENIQELDRLWSNYLDSKGFM